MLNLERLRTLDALARHGSVSGAADGLHVTTSAVSQQMAKLEREVGQPLLAKSGRGVRLTDAGRLLADHAARIISRVELAQADVEARRGSAVGELRIGAFPTAMRGLLPPVLAALRVDHPELRPRVREQEPAEGMAAVVRGDLDLALAIDWHNKRMPVPGSSPGRTCWTTPWTSRCRPPSPRRPGGGLPRGVPRRRLDLLERGAVLPRVARPHPARYRYRAPDRAHRRGAPHPAGLRRGRARGVRDPRLGRGPVPDGVRLLPVSDTVRRHVYAVWRADADRRPSIRAAVEALRQTAGSL